MASASASAPKFAGAGGCDEMRRLASKDASAPRQECPFGGNVPVWCRPLRRALVRELADQRDKVMADLIACVCGCTLPAAACVFAVDGYGAHAWVVHVAGSAYLILNSVIFMQRFVLMLHYSEHRGLWRKRGTGHASSALRALVPCLCPFFGVPPGIYRLHHCVMHHVENNVGLDFSSTTRFRRDSPMHFLAYYVSMVAGIIMLPAYALATGRIDLALRSMAGFVSYGCVVFLWCCKPPGNGSSWLGNEINHQPSDIFYRLRYHHCIVAVPPMRQYVAFGVISCFIWTLCQFCPTATAYVFLLPLLIITVALSLGNWSQHIFINHSHYADGRAVADGRAEDNPMTIDSYCMSYICTETEENQKTFNDGYHTVHHVNSRLHWSELPQRFVSTLDAHEAYGVFVFRGIHFMDVGIACTFCGDRGLRWLATKLVPYRAPASSSSAAEADRLDSIVRALRSRLRPIAM